MVSLLGFEEDKSCDVTEVVCQLSFADNFSASQSNRRTICLFSQDATSPPCLHLIKPSFCVHSPRLMFRDNTSAIVFFEEVEISPKAEQLETGSETEVESEDSTDCCSLSSLDSQTTLQSPVPGASPSKPALVQKVAFRTADLANKV